MKQQTAEENEVLIGLILNEIEPLCFERDKAKWTGKRGKMVILNEIAGVIEAYVSKTISEQSATIENLSSTVVEQESKLDIAVKALEEIKLDIYENDVEQVISIIETALNTIKTKE